MTRDPGTLALCKQKTALCTSRYMLTFCCGHCPRAYSTDPSTDPWGALLVTDLHLDLKPLGMILQPVLHPLDGWSIKSMYFQFRGVLRRTLPMASLKFRWITLVALCALLQLQHHRRPWGWPGRTWPWWSCAGRSEQQIRALAGWAACTWGWAGHWLADDVQLCFALFSPSFLLSDLYLNPHIF